jgi:hypothetical protein
VVQRWIFTVGRYKIDEKQLKQHNTNRWDPPAYLSFCSAKVQVDSYVWPSTSIQKAERLCEALFFYTGKFLNKYCLLQNTWFPESLICSPFFAGRDDITMCFHCGGTLQGWLFTDSLWLEHARLFPKCIYAIHTKGPAFVLDNAGVWVVSKIADFKRSSYYKNHFYLCVLVCFWKNKYLSFDLDVGKFRRFSAV